MNLCQLTKDEQVILSLKLSSAGSKFGKVVHTLGGVALARYADTYDNLSDPFDRSLWAERDRYIAVMDEMHAMACSAAKDGHI